MAQKDYYRILDLNSDASDDEIKKAYRKLAMQYHPDRNHGKEEWANDKIKEINEAFSVLGDPKKRMQYDGLGAVEDIADIFGSQAAGTPFEDLVDKSGGGGLGFDFLDNVFSDNLRGTGFSYYRYNKKRFGGLGGREFETQASAGLEDLFEKAQGPKVSNINYEIVLTEEQASNGLEKELVRNGKRLKVKIPAGVKTGSSIKLRDALKATDGLPGDITVNIKVK